MPPTRTYRRLLIALACLVFALDLGSKYGIFHWLYHGGQPAQDGAFQAWVPVRAWNDGKEIPMLLGGRCDVISGWFGFTAEYLPASKASDNAALAALQTISAPMLPHVNHGALFGLGNGHKGDANTIFAVVSLVAVVAILFWGLKRDNAADRWLSACLGLILGGTLGNLFDRVVFGGVRDFLYFYHPIPFFGDWPVFNFADCCLVSGAAMLFVQALVVPHKKKDATASATAVPSIPLAVR